MPRIRTTRRNDADGNGEAEGGERRGEQIDSDGDTGTAK